jgi:signal transduction histidine kinase
MIEEEPIQVTKRKQARRVAGLTALFILLFLLLHTAFYLHALRRERELRSMGLTSHADRLKFRDELRYEAVLFLILFLAVVVPLFILLVPGKSKQQARRFAGVTTLFFVFILIVIGLLQRFYREQQDIVMVLSFMSVIPLILGIHTYYRVREFRRRVAMADLRSQFVANVSHELKTPLTAIRMYAETMALNRTAPDTYPRYLNTIVAETERLSRLVDTVLEFSKIERGISSHRPRFIHLADILRSACSSLQYTCDVGGFQLTQNLSDVPKVVADPDALHRAVVNLLTNAMKYSGDNRHISLQLRSDGQHALIEVSDHGVGIPPEYQKHIFAPFYRVPIPELNAVPGTGLGLALVDQVARLHGGRVEVRSTVGVGSTFSLIIPLDRSV